VTTDNDSGHMLKLSTAAELAATGPQYKRTRVRGLAPWAPRGDTRAVLDQALAIINEYVAQWPLTLRQVFYALVGRAAYDKTEKAYKNLGEHLNRARRCGLLSFDAIRDGGTTVAEPLAFASREDFIRVARELAADYRLDRQVGQPQYAEVWVEAAGMVPQIAGVVHEYGMPVYSSGGFESTTEKYDAASRILHREQPTVLLLIGDYDPSGKSRVRSFLDDVAQLAVDLGATSEPRLGSLAVTPEQIQRYALPAIPPKETDKRGVWVEGEETVQCEALPPDVLADEVRQGVTSLVDFDALAEIRRQEAVEGQRVNADIETLLEES
jgi:hypothetical protein